MKFIMIFLMAFITKISDNFKLELFSKQKSKSLFNLFRLQEGKNLYCLH